MPSFSTRSYQAELLDDERIPFADIKRNMEELDTINTWLGGHAITIAGLKKILKHHHLLQQQTGLSSITICEIGCGGGNNLIAIDKWLKKKKIKADYIGIDINPHCIAHATTTAGLEHAQWITSDYKLAQFKSKPHIIFSSLFCHHFKDDELVSMLQWMDENAALGFFINDLQRNSIAYYSIKLLTRLFSRSYLVKNDAPISVLRGFSAKELKGLMQRAGLQNCSIEWKWAFRWLLVKTHGK